VYALGVAAGPVAIGLILLLLTREEAVLIGSSFAIGWVAGIGLLAALAVVLVRSIGVSGRDPIWLAAAELAIGAAFLLAAIGVNRRGSKRKPRDPFVHRVDAVTRFGAAGLGVVVSAANPKILALALGAALALATNGDSGPSAAEGAAVFTAIGAMAVVVPLAVYVALPSRCRPALTNAKNWIACHERPVLTLLSLAIGTTFIVDALP